MSAKNANRPAKTLAAGLWNKAKAVAILRHAEIDSQIV
jgi:hypothetical protein